MVEMHDLNRALLIFGVAQMVFLAALLLLKKDKKTHDKLLIGVFLGNGIVIGLSHSNLVLYESVAHFFLLQLPIGYSLAVLVYLHVCSFFEPIKRKHLVLFAPSLLVLGLVLFNYTPLPLQEKMQFFEKLHQNQFTGPKWILVPRIFFGAIYFPLLTFLSIQKAKANKVAIFKNIEAQGTLAWVQKIIWLLCFLNTAILWAHAMEFGLGDFDRAESVLFVFSASAVGFLALAFYGIGKGMIFRFAEEQNERSTAHEKIISDEEVKKQLETLSLVIQEQQLYLNPALRTQDVAEVAGIPVSDIRALFGSGVDISFADFVNQFRVDHFLQMQQDTSFDYLSIEGKAFKSGFNSKSNFYYIFKKIKGKSPSQYLETANK